MSQRSKIRHWLPVGLSALLALCTFSLAQAAMVLSPSTAFDFGKVTVGTTTEKLLTLSNTGPTAVGIKSFSGILTPGPYTQTNTCPATLAANASCQIKLVFAPTTLDLSMMGGVIKMQVIVQADIPVDGSPFSFSGTATASTGTIGSTPTTPTIPLGGTLVLSPPSPLNFGTVLLGQSAMKQLTLTNVGSTSATLSSISKLSAPFTLTNACGTSLAPGASCRLAITYSPTSKDSASASLTVAGSVGVIGSPYSISATPSTAGTVGLALSPIDMYDFGPIKVGTTSTTTITLRNSAQTAASIRSIAALTLPFAQQHNCPTSLNAGASCQIKVSYTPTAEEFKTGQPSTTELVITSVPAIAKYGLRGGPETEDATLTLTPSGTVDFGAVAVGKSAQKSFTVTNSGKGAAKVNLPEVFPPFSIASGTCDGVGFVAGGSSCNFVVQYTPGGREVQLAAAVTGTLRVPGSTKVTGSPLTLSGTASGGDAILSLTPSGPFQFGGVRVGEIGNRVITLSNDGGTAATLSSFTGLAAPYTLKHNCPTSLAAGSFCQLSVSFAPTAADLSNSASALATLTVAASTSVTGSPYVFTSEPRAAPSQLPVLSLSPAGPFSFGTIDVGKVGSKTLTLSNTGNAPAQISGFTGLGNPFVVDSDCPTFLRPAGSCSVKLRYAPTATDSASSSAELTVVASVAVTGSPFLLSGAAKISVASETPAAFTFDTANGVPLNTSTQSNAITVSGITKPVAVKVSNGQYSINDLAYTSDIGAARPGDTIRLRATSSSDYSQTVTASLTVGSATADFVVKTLTQTFSLDATGISASNVVVQPTGANSKQSLDVLVTLGDVTSSTTQAGRFAASSGDYKLYVAVLLPTGTLSFTSPTLLVKDSSSNYVGVASPLAAYLENVLLNSQDTAIKLNVLSDFDFGLISGTEFYLGYGLSDTEMLSAKRYRAFYKVP